MIEGIRTVFVDVDDTLLDFRACARQGLEEACECFGFACSEELFDVFWQVNADLWEWNKQAKWPMDKLYDLCWRKTFEHFGIQVNGGAFEEVFQEKVSEIAVPVEGAEEMLAYLSAKYLVCAASNAAHDQQVSRLKKAGMLPYFRDVFTSEKMGALKPTAAFFDACFACLPGIKPQEACIIGDSLTSDIGGGKAAGLMTIWLNRQHAGASPLADETITSLWDIQNIL